MSWLRQRIKELAQTDAQANRIFGLFHKGLALIYLCAFVPMFFELDLLIGSQGLQPAATLLQQSYEKQGILASLLQFPSVFHLTTNAVMLNVVIGLGSLGSLGLLFGYRIFWSALLAWLSFLSVCSVGGDFYIIIIDLFLAEVGFLTLFSTYCLAYRGFVPKLVQVAFQMLQFKLWFSMGVIKFYLPLNEWTNLTFFDTFFQAQPMPTPMAKIFHQTPVVFKHLALLFLFIGEVLVPFFVFGKAFYRKIAGVTFILISLLIQLNGNYGYFNVLSILLVLTLYSSVELRLQDKPIIATQETKRQSWLQMILVGHLTLQLVYCMLLFHPRPKYYQNHFNFMHTYLDLPAGSKWNAALYPLKLISYWRICNPYGVFKGIPAYHGEIRFSGSQDGRLWKNYQFKYVPSSYTDYLGYYAPYYPRLDHLMFYETLSQSNSKHNTLSVYQQKMPWSQRFIAQLFEKRPAVTKLLKRNPFAAAPPRWIRTNYYRLVFSPRKGKNWKAQKIAFERIYSKDSIGKGPLIPEKVALESLSTR